MSCGLEFPGAEELSSRPVLICFHIICATTCTAYLKHSQSSTPAARWLGHLKKRAVCCFATRRPSSCGSVSTCWASHQYTSSNTSPCCCCCWSCSIASQQKELGSLMKKIGSLIIIKKNVKRSLKNKSQS